jgi:hypothetical protein
MSVHGMPTYGAGAAATVVGTAVRVCVDTGVLIAAVVVTTGGGGAGGRLDIVDRDEGVDDAVVAVSPLPPRVAYTPSTAAATARTPTAEARIGTARDFRWGGGGIGSLLRSCVGAFGFTAPCFGGVAAARVGADAG